MRKSLFALPAIVVAAGLALAGCTTVSSESSAPNGEGVDASQPLAGKTIGVAVVGTQHFWDREAFQGAVDEVEKLGGTVLTTDGNRDNTLHAQNHDIFLAQNVDAVITILGDASVDPKLQQLHDAGIPVFGVDHASEWAVNNAQSDNEVGGTALGKITGDALGGEGSIAVFNAFGSSLSFCGERYDAWKNELATNYPNIKLIEPELAEQFANAPDDARQQTLALLEKYPVGTIQDIHVACWDQPAIGVVQAIEDSGRTDVKVTAFDAGPDTLEIMSEPGSPFVGNIAQLPRKIATISADNVGKYFLGEEVEKVSYVDTIPVAGPDEAKKVAKELGYTQ